MPRKGAGCSSIGQEGKGGHAVGKDSGGVLVLIGVRGLRNAMLCGCSAADALWHAYDTLTWQRLHPRGDDEACPRLRS